MASHTPPLPSRDEALDRSWRLWASLVIAVVALVTLVVGLVVLPARDETGFNPFAAMCRALGIPGYGIVPPKLSAPAAPASDVAWSSETRRLLAQASPQRGKDAAQTCAGCHGPNGISAAPQQFPNLAGQYDTAVFKQLRDYQTGARKSDIMAAMAQPLSQAQMADLAAYYASLPAGGSAAAQKGAAPGLLRLVRDGDPARGIASCDSCHGPNHSGPEGTPSLTGQSAPYLEQQLKNFAGAERGNDSFERMRAIARQLTPDEMHALAVYYSGNPASSDQR